MVCKKMLSPTLDMEVNIKVLWALVILQVAVLLVLVTKLNLMPKVRP